MLNTNLDGNKTKEDFLEELENVFTQEEYSKKIRPMTMEGCTVRLSDIIAYIGRDIEDAIIVGSIKRKDIPENVAKILGNNNSNIVDTLIKDVIINSMDKPYLAFSKEVFNALMELKEWNYKYIYDSEEANINEDLIKEMFNKLFYIYFEKINEYIKYNKEPSSKSEKILFNFASKGINQKSSNCEIKRKVIDFISGQTDQYFLKECEEYIKDSKKINTYK